MKVVNILAGPGAGKSTTAAALFSSLKRQDIKCELVTEYAKEVEYEQRYRLFEDQLYITAKQNRRLKRLSQYNKKLDYVVTDSSLLLGIMYSDCEKLHDLILKTYHEYDNINFLINRKKKYQTYGRSQTEAEARYLDVVIEDILKNNNIPYYKIDNEFDILEIIK